MEFDPGTLKGFDPDQALEEMRELHAAGGTEADFDLMLELFISLDTWLLKGNSLPKCWEVKRHGRPH